MNRFNRFLIGSGERAVLFVPIRGLSTCETSTFRLPYFHRRPGETASASLNPIQSNPNGNIFLPFFRNPRDELRFRNFSFNFRWWISLILFGGARTLWSWFFVYSWRSFVFWVWFGWFLIWFPFQYLVGVVHFSALVHASFGGSAMKFGQTFTEYLHGEQEAFLNKFSHVEYKHLKKVLKSCRICRSLNDDGGAYVSKQRDDNELPTEYDQCDSCACMSSFPTNRVYFRLAIDDLQIHMNWNIRFFFLDNLNSIWSFVCVISVALYRSSQLPKK